MKYLTYISTFIFLLSACAAGGENKMMRPESVKDTEVIQRYEPRITPAQPEKKQINKNKTEEAEISTEDFNEITRQKTKQFLDMLAVVNNRKNPEDLQAYIDKYARKLWAKPANSKAVFQHQGLKKIDSFQIVETKLLSFEEQKGTESIGNYRLLIKAYHKGKPELIKLNTKMYFEVNDLNVDGDVYKTITAKILEMKL